MPSPSRFSVKNWIIFFLFAATVATASAETKNVAGYSSGWQSFDPPTAWSNQPIGVYVDDVGRFYVVAGSERTIRGCLKRDQLRPLLQDIRTALSLAGANYGRTRTLNTYLNEGEVRGEKTGVRLTFRSDISGGALELLVLDFQSSKSRTTLCLLRSQMETLAALLERVPDTFDALANQSVPTPPDKKFTWQEWALGVPLMIAVVVLVIQQLNKARSLREKDRQLVEAAKASRELNANLQKLNTAYGVQAEKLATAGAAFNQAEKDHADRIKELRTMLANAAFIRTVSERELVKAFIEMITIRQLDRDTPSPTSGVHDLSQTQEQALADIMAHDRNRFILIEFKRELASFALELTEKGEVRGPQIAKIRATVEMTTLSTKCHFGGWGVQGHKTPIEFAPYLDTWTAFESQDRTVPAVPIDEFIEGFLPNIESEARYGAPFPEFREYVRLLEDNAPKSGTNSATAPLLLVVRTPNNLPEFIPVPNMIALMKMVQAIEQKIEQQKKIAQELSQKAAHQSKGFGRRISRSGPSSNPPHEIGGHEL